MTVHDSGWLAGMEVLAALLSLAFICTPHEISTKNSIITCSHVPFLPSWGKPWDERVEITGVSCDSGPKDGRRIFISL